jgi:L-lactate dehydrogenase complex protein LldF
MNRIAQEFHQKAREKASDQAHRQTIRRAIDTYETAVTKGRARFADYEAARERCAEIKWEAVNHLDRYLDQFETNVVQRGGHVFWASDSEHACRYVLELALRHRVKTIVKSKSMVTEEIQLNADLERNGLRVMETDLGEYIVQLRQEPPYHIVTPAMHLSREQIAELFREKIPGDVTGETHEELVGAARRSLRRDFFSAEMGITGANFLVADTGMIAITSNEGNARLCTSRPRIHVAIAGIEKVIPRLQDLAVLWPTLATAGTGQSITAYSTLIGGPRMAGENDGPEEFHVILLDNGRSRLLADPEQRDLLQCIRCGACLNACPVYRNVGGHAYATVYQGPIGSALTPPMRGLAEFQHLSYASSLCGNCTSVCPVKIDLAHHLVQNRRNVVAIGERPWPERTSMRLWAWCMLSAERFKLASRLGRTMLRVLNAMGLAAPILKSWTEHRQLPPVPKSTFRQMWRNNAER